MGQQTVNTFNEGINFDLNPITTPNNVLTDCINGTFITFNGDELALQNDAGNTKIEYTKQTTAIIDYGALYNWYTVIDSRGIAPIGFHIPSKAEWETLLNYVDDPDINGYFPLAGNKLKSIGTIFWDSPNTGATNDVGFYAVGAGVRSQNGDFFSINGTNLIWTTQVNDSNTSFYVDNYANYSVMRIYGNDGFKQSGMSIRFVADSGNPTSVVGNDGKVYSCVTIGSQTWTASNSNETKFRNGDWIHGYDNGIYTAISNVNWAALTSSAMCYYNNNINNTTEVVNKEIIEDVHLSEGFYPLGIKEYGGVLYIISGKLPLDPKTNAEITLWVQNTTYLKDKIVYYNSPTEKIYYKAKKNTSADLPIVTSQDWEVIGNEKDYNNMFGEVEFGSYPSPSSSGSITYEGNTINLSGTVLETIYRWQPTGLNSYCLTDINGKNTGYRMTEEQYQSSSDGGITWINVPDTPVRNVSVINTTVCPLPVAFVGMVLDTTTYNIVNEYQIAYAPGQNTWVDTPIKSGFNYLFFSVPSTLTLTIIDAMGINVTNEFSVFGIDNRPAYQTNTIYKKNNMFATEQSTRFNLIFT